MIITVTINIFVLNLIQFNEGAKILGIFPSSGYSHYILGNTLMKGLADAGHHVTMISPYHKKQVVSNFKYITIEPVKYPIEGPVTEEKSHFIKNFADLYYTGGLMLTEHALNHTNVQKLLHSNATFDIVISELFVNEAHMALSQHFKAPLILFSSLGASEWSNHLVANPFYFSYMPIIFTGFTNQMTFLQRLQNTVIGIYEIIYKHLIIYPKQNEIINKYFFENYGIYNVIYNVSLILLNSHVAINGAIPHTPTMVEIGGFHISEKQLPKDLQEFLDSAKHGVIYFSMGSNVKTSQFSKEKVQAILKVFSNLNQKILWKWENETFPGKPKNVKLSKWLPQQAVLAHPNVKVFISQSGLISTIEAVYGGVPLICIPIYGDQRMNCEKSVSDGYAIKMSFNNINKKTFGEVLNEILSNPRYKDEAIKRSIILKDQPIQSMDKAIFWIEYVLRHKGALHLRSAALNLRWYEYLLFDVVVFVFIIILLIILCLRMICSYIKNTLVHKSIKQKKL